MVNHRQSTVGAGETRAQDRVGSPISPGNRVTATEWDKNAEARARQIRSGRDLSRDLVIVPAMLKALTGPRVGRLLDIGCGEGEFTARLRSADVAREILGIDISERMIEIAMNRHSDSQTCFRLLEAERAAGELGAGSFHAVTANMVLNTAPNLNGVVAGVRDALKPGGHFVFSILHPTFFHRTEAFRRLIPADFDPDREAQFVRPFTISLDPDPLPSEIHFYHRPIGTYLKVLTANLLCVTDLLEPWPPGDAEPAYLATWSCPRFLIVRARRVR
jgi:2-polyprenyl-3-methyl-5-hydroxy-6-metoxy-1,4-benzoquinol methylase